MGHQTKTNEDMLTKTFIFKTTVGNNEITTTWKPAMEEYCRYYNDLSAWIAKQLTTMRIGDMAQYIKNHDSNYYNTVTSDAKKDLPLYKAFKKGISAMDVDNALYAMISKLNPENYKGNMLGLTETDYRRMGYVQAVISNYRTKMATLKSPYRWKRFNSEEADEKTLLEQSVVDVQKYNIESKTDFKELIKTLRLRENQKAETIERLECLFNYYKDHEAEIKTALETSAVESLQKFVGCRRNDTSNTMTIHRQSSVIEKHGRSSFNITLFFNKKPYVIPFLGNRQVVTVDKDGNRSDIVDIISKHGDIVTFKAKKDSKNKEHLFIHLSVPVEFDKQPAEIKKIVGIDVNIKHMMLSTDIVDNGQLEGYINLYKELLADKAFKETITSDAELQQYTQMSESVNFCLLETPSLWARVENQLKGGKLDNDLTRRELAMKDVFDRITRESKDIHVVNYVNYNKKLRAAYKAYYILRNKYIEEQQKFDQEQGYNDQSTQSKETMDKRRFENPFNDTPIAMELLSKMENVRQDIIGCRDNIITYAFNVIKNNGYDTISMEYLDNSQFDKTRMPTPTSLLKYHKFEGKSMDEIDYSKFNKDYYKFILDDNGKITDIQYTTKGIFRKKQLEFHNQIIKAIHFADVKDKFTQLANNNHMNIGFLPAAFTSQMDSTSHSLYFVEQLDTSKKKPKKKIVLAHKKSVRGLQERHINGLNADFNSARNLSFMLHDQSFREAMTMQTLPGKSLYNTPAFNIQKKFKKTPSINSMNTIRQLGHYKIGTFQNGQFLESMSTTNN